MNFTKHECDQKLLADIEEHAVGLDRCLRIVLPDERYVSLVSFTFNVGVGAACKSSVVRLINDGQTRAGCDALLRWNKAGGVEWKGLTRRREAERKMCLEGL